MRALPVRRAASSALCAALLVGITGPAASAADTGGGRTRVTTRPSDPTTDALRAQVGTLGRYGGVLTPVTDLLTTVLADRHGRLPAREAHRLVTAAEHAVAEVKPAAGRKQHRAADPQDDALASLQSSLDALVKAVTSGDLGQLIPAVTATVSGVVGVVTGLLGGSLTAPSLPSPSGLPSTPSLPSTSNTSSASVVGLPSVPGVSLPHLSTMVPDMSTMIPNLSAMMPDLSAMLPAGTATVTDPAATVTDPDDDATVTVPDEDDDVVTLPAELSADPAPAS
ncbi:hypothetical protein [Streptomyces mangrovisoli]|uniref:Secreted protein n=1 Tax=Streptomyces mangrovisoli TaxID=1428628 RepID=A0A1J4P3N6_9ACTN|nr:hypothetical protein [Streptomyces mangrovisoli]OIJ69369.1 hypothetical protein WN71_002350 [Streptomyces mangrovisoli]